MTVDKPNASSTSSDANQNNKPPGAAGGVERAIAPASPNGVRDHHLRSDAAPLPSPSSTAASPRRDDHEKTTTTTTMSLRKRTGTLFSDASDLINENLVVVRYATVSTVVLLGAYGIANTPLFHRYKSAWDIPTRMFVGRRRMHGRIVGIVKNDNEAAGAAARTRRSGGSATTMRPPSESTGWNRPPPSSSSSSDGSDRSGGLAYLLSASLRKATETKGSGSSSSGDAGDGTVDSGIPTDQQHPVVVLFRHSSPVERLMTQSAMERVLSFAGRSSLSSSPSSSSSRLLYSSATDPHRNLIPVELAGVVAAPPSSSHHGSILDDLVRRKARVSLQLLARRTGADRRTKSEADGRIVVPADDGVRNAAICHVRYRRPDQWFFSTTNNVGVEMVGEGSAAMNSSGTVLPPPDGDDGEGERETVVVDFEPTARQLQEDAAFVSELEEAEYSAWKSGKGMWSSSRTRDLRPEYAEEEDRLRNRLSESVWGWMKKGWERIRSNK